MIDADGKVDTCECVAIGSIVLESENDDMSLPDHYRKFWSRAWTSSVGTTHTVLIMWPCQNDASILPTEANEANTTHLWSCRVAKTDTHMQVVRVFFFLELRLDGTPDPEIVNIGRHLCAYDNTEQGDSVPATTCQSRT